MFCSVARKIEVQVRRDEELRACAPEEGRDDGQTIDKRSSMFFYTIRRIFVHLGVPEKSLELKLA
jgi:hypothetical protein